MLFVALVCRGYSLLVVVVVVLVCCVCGCCFACFCSLVAVLCVLVCVSCVPCVNMFGKASGGPAVSIMNFLEKTLVSFAPYLGQFNTLQISWLAMSKEVQELSRPFFCFNHHQSRYKMI